MGSDHLCVGGTVRRKGGVQLTGDGTVEFDIELDTEITGETVYLQSLFRDPLIGVGATNASSFVFQPD